jgi:hypothetical protein
MTWVRGATGADRRHGPVPEHADTGGGTAWWANRAAVGLRRPARDCDWGGYPGTLASRVQGSPGAGRWPQASWVSRSDLQTRLADDLSWRAGPEMAGRHR